MNPPVVTLKDTQGPPEYASCPEVTIEGFCVPGLRRVVVDAPFDDIATVTITIIAKVIHK